MERVPFMQTKMHGEIVRFDNWGHSSGERWAYIICNAPGHAASYGSCSKYRQVPAFKSEKECCSWLVAQAKAGPRLAD
eukprot:12433594-Alexandrium_andersonii.AAC.1